MKGNALGEALRAREPEGRDDGPTVPVRDDRQDRLHAVEGIAVGQRDPVAGEMGLDLHPDQVFAIEPQER